MESLKHLDIPEELHTLDFSKFWLPANAFVLIEKLDMKPNFRSFHFDNP